LIALATLAGVHGTGTWAADPIWTVLTMQPLLGGLMTCLGVLVSLRASTVRGAQQTLMLVAVGTVVVLFGGMSLLPEETRMWLRQLLAEWSAGALTFAASLAILAVDAALLLAAGARFQRTRLSLD
jgi:ABC-2 type transport system permease protein